MKLAFKSTFLSIKEFPSVTVPPFTLITGRNGSGKTHLLKAIVAGSITIDTVQDRNVDVRLFDWNTMVPTDSGEFRSEDL